MQTYPAIFELQSEGGYTVTFPDLPGCISEGDTEQEATSMALDALQGFIEALRQDGDETPKPSSFEKVKQSIAEDQVVVMVPVLFNDIKHKRINVSLGESLLERIDLVSKREGLTRSGFISLAAREYLGRFSGSV